MNTKPKHAPLGRSQHLQIRCRSGEMAEGEVPEKVRKANDARWREYGKMVRIERKLQKKILKTLDQGPPSLG